MKLVNPGKSRNLEYIPGTHSGLHPGVGLGGGAIPPWLQHTGTTARPCKGLVHRSHNKEAPRYSVNGPHGLQRPLNAPYMAPQGGDLPLTGP